MTNVAAYFAPSFGVLRGIGRLARRGSLRIVTAAKSDNDTTIAAARHTYARLLKRGARVFEFQPQKLHVKLFVIDAASYVGSANCDMRSLFLNLESGGVGSVHIHIGNTTVAFALQLASLSDSINRQQITKLGGPATSTATAHHTRDKVAVLLHVHKGEEDRVERKE